MQVRPNYIMHVNFPSSMLDYINGSLLLLRLILYGMLYRVSCNNVQFTSTSKAISIMFSYYFSTWNSRLCFGIFKL